MSQAALVYSHSKSPRLQYIIDFLSRYFALEFKLVYDEGKYLEATDNCKINYGYHRLAPGEIFIHSHVLLFESSVRPVKAECFEKNGYKVFFRAEGELGFDLFAAVFYLLSRYEEYLPHQKDAFGRFAHQNALAFKEGFLHLPLVNIWLEDFRKLLAEKNPDFARQQPKFSFLPTYDIDIAWSFRNKGFRRNAGAILLLLLQFKFGKMVHRIRVIRGKRTDPFDAYEWMDELHGQYGWHPIYFFLVARSRGKYDKNIDPGNAAFRQLVQDLASRYTVGLHPSWASGDHPALLLKEKTTLEKITVQKIDKSRQHFIRLSLPTTYQRLASAGITEDYSMGYGSINGFRASIASSFYWYDLKNDEATSLLLHPFCFMDANAFYEQKLKPEEAAAELDALYQVVRSVNGTMITIWHNSFLGTAPEFAGWRQVYQNFIAGLN